MVNHRRKFHSELLYVTRCSSEDTWYNINKSAVKHKKKRFCQSLQATIKNWNNVLLTILFSNCYGAPTRVHHYNCERDGLDFFRDFIKYSHNFFLLICNIIRRVSTLKQKKKR